MCVFSSVRAAAAFCVFSVISSNLPAYAQSSVANTCRCATYELICGSSSEVSAACGGDYQACALQDTCRIYALNEICVSQGLTAGIRNTQDDQAQSCAPAEYALLEDVPESFIYRSIYECCVKKHEIAHLCDTRDFRTTPQDCVEVPAQSTSHHCMREAAVAVCRDHPDHPVCRELCYGTFAEALLYQRYDCTCTAAGPNANPSREMCDSCETQCKQFSNPQAAINQVPTECQPMLQESAMPDYTNTACSAAYDMQRCKKPTPSPTPVPSSTPTSPPATPSSTPSPGMTSSPTPNPTATPAYTPNPTYSATSTPSPALSPVPSSTPGATPSSTLSPAPDHTTTPSTTPVPAATTTYYSTPSPTWTPQTTPASTSTPHETLTPIPPAVPYLTSTPSETPAYFPTGSDTPPPVPTQT